MAPMGGHKQGLHLRIQHRNGALKDSPPGEETAVLQHHLRDRPPQPPQRIAMACDVQSAPCSLRMNQHVLLPGEEQLECQRNLQSMPCALLLLTYCSMTSEPKMPLVDLID